MESDAAIIPDIVIFASFDPIALDKACIDAVNSAPVIQGSALGDSAGDAKESPCNCDGKRDHFRFVHPSTNWRSQIEHGEAIGLGSGNYELVTVK